MKQLFILSVILCSLCSSAQNLPVPNGKPVLPTPKLRVLAPADLLVSSMELQSATFSRTTGKWTLIVRLTVKNNGEQPSRSTDIKPFASVPGTMQATYTGGATTLNILKAGESITREISFTGKDGVRDMHKNFKFFVILDSNYYVKESNETNNSSPTLSILIND